QATERYFAAALLVFTGTKPTTHKLDELAAMVAPLHPLLAEPFPMATEEDERLFNLLRRAYIEARYKKTYRITADELAVLGERVKHLAGRVERACGEAIAAMAGPAGGEADAGPAGSGERGAGGEVGPGVVSGAGGEVIASVAGAVGGEVGRGGEGRIG
ncbi:MAG TPA: HEPN domain-containing protein, partial [Polyangiaceae bacterium]|nr:HEPN domain-containing protein [Polyangiaceae bacterium]